MRSCSLLLPAALRRHSCGRARIAQARRCFGDEGHRRRTVLRGRTRATDDPWTLLGVDRSASSEDVKKAYISLAKKCHPDTAGGDDTEFKKVKEAYDLVKSGRAKELYPEPGGDRWARGFAGFQNPRHEEAQSRGYEYSSSQTTYDSRGGSSTTFTYRDRAGDTYSYTETVRADLGGTDFWKTFSQAHAEALKMENERMRERAQQDQSEFRRLFENWAHHQNQQSQEYAAYLQARDQAVYRYLLAFVVTFLVLRFMLSILV